MTTHYSDQGLSREVENLGIGAEMQLFPELPEEFFLQRKVYPTMCGIKVSFEGIVDHGASCDLCSRIFWQKRRLREAAEEEQIELERNADRLAR